jgi:peptidoglycan/LPS O-acetylase OafA/YrhL
LPALSLRPSDDAARAPRPGPAPLPAHLPALDGLRGVAVLTVMSSHFFQQAVGEATTPAGRLVQSGWLGVDLFFVLSGFLITGRLVDTRGRENYFNSFYVKRSLRIFPLYYAALVLVFGVAAFRGGVGSGWDGPLWYFAYASNVAIVGAGRFLMPVAGFTLNHFWSLAVEEQFYLVWPLVVRWLPRLLLAVLCLVLVAGATPLRMWADESTGAAFASYVLMPLRLDGLATGALVALAVRRWSFERWGVPAFIVACVSGFGLVDVLAFDLTRWQWRGTFSCLVFGAVLAASLPASGPMARLLSSGLLRWCGVRSYGLYVFHHLFKLGWMAALKPSRLVDQLGPVGGAGLYALGAGLGSAAVAAVSWRWFEKPVLRWKARFG